MSDHELLHLPMSFVVPIEHESRIRHRHSHKSDNFSCRFCVEKFRLRKTVLNVRTPIAPLSGFFLISKVRRLGSGIA